MLIWCESKTDGDSPDGREVINVVIFSPGSSKQGDITMNQETN